MPDYILASELELLRSVGFAAGFSGESWFCKDPIDTNYWQAYQVGNDDYMTFVSGLDRASRYLTRQEFKEKFGG